jgi:hypothetical protein
MVFVMQKSKILLYLLIFFVISCSNNEKINVELSKYPDGKDFAFTITDDPDYGSLDEKVIMYDFLNSLGFKTTVPVWVLDNKHGTGEGGVLSNTRGITTTNEAYLKYIKDLQKKGFEIGLHTVSPGNDLRKETIEGYELFRKNFGDYPKININHANNLEDIYWGADRFSSGLLRSIYKLKEPDFQGHKENSKYFWGDICKGKTKYMRGWATDNINTLSTHKSIPYHLKDKPYVNYWFGCSDGNNYDRFMKLVSDRNISKLVSERGTSIIYTHFAYGFVDKQSITLKKDFKERMFQISQLNGWFVPVSMILDRFILLRNVEIIKKDNFIVIVNHNDEAIDGLTILTDQKRLYFFNKNEWLDANKQGEINLGTLHAYSAFKLGKSQEIQLDYAPKAFERISMVWDWFIGRFNK